MQLWIVGKTLDHETSSWEFQGCFDTEEKAIAACHGYNFFVAPSTLNEEMPIEGVAWAGAFYPECAARTVALSSGDRGIVRDANGEEVEYCLKANLDTGVCVVLKRSKNGYIFTDDGKEVQREIVHRPSPLSFEPADNINATESLPKREFVVVADSSLEAIQQMPKIGDKWPEEKIRAVQYEAERKTDHEWNVYVTFEAIEEE